MKEFFSNFSQSLVYDENDEDDKNTTNTEIHTKGDELTEFVKEEQNIQEINVVFPKLDFPPRVLIAFSGGVDSMVLLHQAIRSKQAGLITSLRATYIDHGISEHSKTWGDFCAQFCKKYAIPFTIHRVFLTKKEDANIANLEGNARKARYTALQFEQQCDEWLCTAQHLDDQIETFFIMLLRGSGLNGLSCMTVKDDEKRMIRPLLKSYWTKELILSYAQHYDLKWIEDGSNQDFTYRRNWLRHQILPDIEAQYPSYRETMMRSIEHIQNALKIHETALAFNESAKCHEKEKSVNFFPYLPNDDQEIREHQGRVVVGHHQLVKFPITLKEKSEAAFQKKFIIDVNQLTSKESLRSWLKSAGLKQYPSLGQLEILWIEIEKVRHQKTFFSPDFMWQNAELTAQKGFIRAYREHLFLFVTQYHFKAWIEQAYPKLLNEDLYSLRLFKINHTLDEYPLKAVIPFSRIKQRFVPRNRKPIPKNIKKVMQEFKIPSWVKPHLELYSVFSQKVDENTVSLVNDTINKKNTRSKEYFCQMTGLPLIYHIGGI